MSEEKQFLDDCKSELLRIASRHSCTPERLFQKIDEQLVDPDIAEAALVAKRFLESAGINVSDIK